MKKIVFLSTIIISMFISMFSAVVFAQFTSISIANTYLIDDEDAVSGDIISNTSKGLFRTNVPYDNSMLGVLTDEPVAVFRAESGPEKAIATGGVAVVNVVNANGEVKKGDFVTSSTTPGKGMRATNSGNVLGIALNDAEGGQVDVSLRMEYAEINSPQSLKRLFDLLGRGLSQSADDPERFSQLVRYMAAGLAILLAILLALLTFARSVPKAIEAIGRNPLARNSIYLSLVVSVIIMIVIVAIGIGAALIVLRI